MIITVERLDNGDLAFRCSVCEYKDILPISYAESLFFDIYLGMALMKALYHNSAEIRETGIEVRTGDTGVHHGTI